MRVKAVIRGLGHRYADGLEQLSVDVQKREANGLPYQDGVRFPIQIVVAGTIYEGGFRTTGRMPTVWISPDLRNHDGTRISLARVLNDAGFHKNQAVTLNVTGTRFELAALRGS